jgi:hypothetical protein
LLAFSCTIWLYCRSHCLNRREEMIKAHYASRIAQLSQQVQFADSKASALHEECRALSMQVQV